MVTLSILIPVYNVEQYLEECLDSIFVNNDFGGEVICVDDGSTDGSTAILELYANRYPNLKVIRLANAGVSVARNVALRAATGDYVLFIDSDDYYADNAINTFVSRINGEDILYFNCQRFMDDDKSLLSISSLPKASGMNGRQYYDQYFNRKNFMPCVCVWAGGYRRSFLMENGLFLKEGVAHGEDEDFYPRLLYYAQRVSTINDVLCFYRLRRGSAVSSPSSCFGSDFLDVASGLFDFFTEKDWVNQTTRNTVFYLYHSMMYYTQKYKLPRPKEYNLRQVKKMLACSTTLQDRRTALLSAVSFDLALKYSSFVLPKYQRRLINFLLH